MPSPPGRTHHHYDVNTDTHRPYPLPTSPAYLPPLLPGRCMHSAIENTSPSCHRRSTDMQPKTCWCIALPKQHHTHYLLTFSYSSMPALYRAWRQPYRVWAPSQKALALQRLRLKNDANEGRRAREEEGEEAPVPSPSRYYACSGMYTIILHGGDLVPYIAGGWPKYRTADPCSAKRYLSKRVAPHLSPSTAPALAPLLARLYSSN